MRPASIDLWALRGMITSSPGPHSVSTSEWIPLNAHKSILAGLVFSGAVPVYLEPAVDPLWGIPLTVSAEAAHRALAEHPAAKAIFVTSPTYNGLGAALAAVAAAAHAAGVPFVTDQAWGPHLRFCPELPVDAMTAGADAAVV